MQLLPGLAEVNDVDAVHRAAEDVALHAEVNIASAQVGLADLADRICRQLMFLWLRLADCCERKNIIAEAITGGASS